LPLIGLAVNYRIQILRLNVNGLSLKQ
jgi:hypothetical protein